MTKIMDRDILGRPFEQLTLPLGEDAEGELVATLVRYSNPQPTTRAVLYIHGFVDYFFHTELASRYIANRFNFYALDLRKYGRSLRPHHTANQCRDVRGYFVEIDRAMEIIKERDGNRQLLLNGHSTGGLIAALYAHRERNRGTIDALFLNSPFFEFNEPWFTKSILLPLAAAAGRVFPAIKVSPGLSPIYGISLHRDYRGEWAYNLDWKPIEGYPVLAGWVRAIHRAQRRLQAGLNISCPVLVMFSKKSSTPKEWDDNARQTDTVLNVRDIDRYADGLGNKVSKVQIEGGMHDLMLSGPEVRQRVYKELHGWLDTRFPPIV